MKSRFPLILGVCVLFAMGCTQEKKATSKTPPKAPAAAPSSAPAPKAANNAADVVQGKTHYMRACAPCHGLDGSGAQMKAMLPKIGDLTSAAMHARLRDPEIINLIKKGRGKMPPMAKALTPEQIGQITAYIRTLKK